MGLDSGTQIRRAIITELHLAALNPQSCPGSEFQFVSWKVRSFDWPVRGPAFQERLVRQHRIAQIVRPDELAVKFEWSLPMSNWTEASR